MRHNACAYHASGILRNSSLIHSVRFRCFQFSVTQAHSSMAIVMISGRRPAMLLTPPYAPELPSAYTSIQTSPKNGPQIGAVATTCLERRRQTLYVATFLPTCQLVFPLRSCPPSILLFLSLPYSPSTICHFVRGSTRNGTGLEAAPRPRNRNPANNKHTVPRRHHPPRQQQIASHHSLSSNRPSSRRPHASIKPPVRLHLHPPSRPHCPGKFPSRMSLEALPTIRLLARRRRLYRILRFRRMLHLINMKRGLRVVLT